MDLNRILFGHLFYLTLKIRREWFIPELRQLERSQYWSKEALEGLQLSKLNRLLAHAHDHLSYYKDKVPRRISSMGELAELPLIEKETLRSKAEAFMWNKGLYQRLKTTGGSTGAPVTLLKDSKGMRQEMAARWRGYAWAGVNIGDRQARFWGIPRNPMEKWRAALIDFICNRRRIIAFGYNEAYFGNTLKRLRSFKPDYMYGYVSIISEFADYLRNSGQELDFSIKSIITTAEVLTDIDRNKLKTVFNASVYNEYGCGEIGTIAHECEQGNLHVNAENIILEILNDKGKPAKVGQPGEIVVTDLSNFSMPLIRYRIKDFGSLSHEPCACRRGLPILKKIHGREYNSLLNMRGECFHGEFFLYIIEDAKKKGYAVDGVQFIQEKNLSLNVLIVCKDSDFSEIKKIIIRRISQDFDSHIKVEIQKVDRILREASGKLCVVKRLDR